jgi:hypothetical protein
MWFDGWEIESRGFHHVKINDGIRENKFLAIVLSPDARRSEWVIHGALS